MQGQETSGVHVVAAAIVRTLAKEFSIREEEARVVLELLAAGYRSSYMSRYRRADVGGLTESAIRRLDRRRKQLEEFERRRASLLRGLGVAVAESNGPGPNDREPAVEPAATEGALEKSESPATDPRWKEVFDCQDRHELEDHFLPHRRPEPEVQLALDRGLAALADLIVTPAPKTEDVPATETKDRSGAAPLDPPGSSASRADLEPSSAVAVAEEAPSESSPSPTEQKAPAASDSVPGIVSEDSSQPSDSPSGALQETESDSSKREGGRTHTARPPLGPSSPTHRIDLSPQLARLCQPFVNPDRGVHTEMQALEGAMRVLSDRLGRSPAVRALVRRMVRKSGRLSVRSLVDEKKLGRNRAILRIHDPVKQIQGHRLLTLRQAQVQRQVSVHVEVDKTAIVPKVRSSLGKRLNPDYASVVDAVVEEAVTHRVLPMIEDDVRGDLRERAEEEALRFLERHLRQILLAPPAGRRPVAGVDVNARGDWTIVALDQDGRPASAEIKIQVSGKTPGDLAKELGDALRSSDVRALSIGHGKGAREATLRIRECIQILAAEAGVFVVNEAGLSNYANSELARSELPEFSVPARMAISIGRRLQDPLRELLKSDPRHLGLGREQSVVSKANLRRLLHDTIESCVAYVGCELNEAPLHVLRHVPGLDFDTAKKIVNRRETNAFTGRVELMEEGLLDELRWANAVGFLHIWNSPEPLDRTSLHPEQYELVRRVIDRIGGSVEDVLGRRDATRGLVRTEFEVDEATWRDLTREIAFPGRDPRLRLFMPELLPFDQDPTQLQKDQVVEGIVTNVTSFGAFVDLGIPRDGMIHVSEVSDRYVRDARALLSIGQIIRARIVNAGGPRIELSLKHVPARRRERPITRGKQDRERSRSRGERKEAWPKHQPVMRAARSRRDGLVIGSEGGSRGGSSRGRGRGSGGGGGPGRPGKGRGGERRHGNRRDEGFDAAAVKRASGPPGQYNPFATFFKGKEKAEGSVDESNGAEQGA